MISTEEVKNLANLARLRLSVEETERFKGEISSILNYIDSINSVDVQQKESSDDNINVFREDEITNKPDEYTERILQAAPERNGRYIKVPRILSQDE
ncbi:MAG: Asp-tRNA(Asn)/Glu-tRNA(Gln) amidotransferase subunit GatC [Candidatus Paceibacterota bacterium]